MRGIDAFNLGTGHGNSVLEVLAAFEKACGKPLPHVVEPRRCGDIAACWAATEKSDRLLGWRAQYDLERMCRDSWRFAKGRYAKK
jgi:UDP-glucose 4-epimerase